MADHNVTLLYASENNFCANPPTIAVRPGETIGFKLADGSLGGSIRITFHDRRFFSTRNPAFHTDGVFHGGDGDVTVVTALTGPTSYHCELLNNQNQVIGRSHEHVGGECVPAN